jgi:hypothetical protein
MKDTSTVLGVLPAQSEFRVCALVLALLLRPQFASANNTRPSRSVGGISFWKEKEDKLCHGCQRVGKSPAI